MDFLSARTKKNGRCREVAVSGGWTVTGSVPGVVILSFNRIVGGKVLTCTSPRVCCLDPNYD